MVSKFSNQQPTDCPLLINARRRINAVDARRPVRAADRQKILIAVRRIIRSPDPVNLETENTIPPVRHCDGGGRVASVYIRRFRAAPGNCESVRPLSVLMAWYVTLCRLSLRSGLNNSLYRSIESKIHLTLISQVYAPSPALLAPAQSRQD
jgi:hypothetical protein